VWLWYDVNMSGQLKFLLTLVVLVGLFLFLQEKFSFLDISITENSSKVEEQKENNSKKESSEEKKDYVDIYMEEGKSVKVNVEVANTEIERRNGLSNRQYLGDYDGMWFIFDEDVKNSFWMKDMLIPLDIIFVDSSGFIVDIKENNASCTDSYCPNIISSTSYRYVLEVNGNFCQENGVEVGHSITAHISSDNPV
jgi:uncharacterized membrane protein (UPF0127 family)